MLAPYPDRLRSSRSTPAQGNAGSTPTPSPPPPHALPPNSSSSTPHHRLFPPRSNLPGTRMRTNSLSSPSPPHHSDSPSSSTDFVLPSSLRNAARRSPMSTRPSTSSGVPDKKHVSAVPSIAPLPLTGASSGPVSPLFACGSALIAHRLFTLIKLKPFPDLVPARRKSTKRPSSRKETVVSSHLNRTSGAIFVGPAQKDARLSTPDRAILEELKLGAAARESQFKMKGNKKHHAYAASEAPYPCDYERQVMDQYV
jgi:hypothetical protein